MEKMHQLINEAQKLPQSQEALNWQDTYRSAALTLILRNQQSPHLLNAVETSIQNSEGSQMS
jgi:hypothetical protein